MVGAKRTAIGAFGGRLKDHSSVDLAEIATKAALESAKLDPQLVDSVTVGNVIQVSSRDGPYIARHLGLRIGVKQETPCLVVNRLCGSGMQAAVNACQDICLRDGEIAIASSSESMNQAPFLLRNGRFGVKFSQTPDLECSIWSTLTDQHIKTPMGITAENLAEKYKLSRQECDEFALLSTKRWKAALDAGKFKSEIVPIPFKNKKTGAVDLFEVDEHPKPSTTIEQLAKLPAVFKKNGAVTAGNASGVCDGGASVILASEDAVKKHNLTPLARVVGYSVVGCAPEIMGIGPSGSIRKLCKQTGVSLDKIDVIEINEAFASVSLANIKELGLDINKTNINGGAIALGHPIGMSGGRILVNLTHELVNSKKEYAIGSLCIGGGQGISMMLQRV